MSSAWLPTYEENVLQVAGYAEIWTPFDNVTGTGTLLLGDILYVSGSVTIDRNNVFRRTASKVTLLLDNAGLLLPVANAGSGYFSPYGNELRLYKGCIEPGPTTEYAQLGVYLIGEVVVNDDGTGVTLVGTVSDRGQWISRRGFAGPGSVSGAVYGVVGDCIVSILGGADIGDAAFTYAGSAWSGGSSPCPYIPGNITFTVGDDPWQICCDLAATAGLELYFDYEGNLVLDYVPDPNSITPCVSYLEGTSTAPVSIARDLSNVSVPNCICVMSQGSSTTAPVMVWWWDSNSSSETYYAPGPAGGFDPSTPQYTLPGQVGTYPRMIQEFNSSVIGPTFQAEQAQAVAIAIGLTSIGSLEAATFTIRDQPAHDVDDVITFQRVIAGIPSSTNYIVDQVQVDLTPTTAEQLTTRLVYV